MRYRSSTLIPAVFNLSMLAAQYRVGTTILIYRLTQSFRGGVNRFGFCQPARSFQASPAYKCLYIIMKLQVTC